ncbi:transposase [Bradyrhizobium sp. 193]|nr:transposase [Bradyrhizobium sp. 193]
MSKLLSSMPGIGPITAAALVATGRTRPCFAPGGSSRPGMT